MDKDPKARGSLEWRALMSELAKELRAVWSESPAHAGLMLRAAQEIERLERELRHQKDLVDGYKRIAAQS